MNETSSAEIAEQVNMLILPVSQQTEHRKQQSHQIHKKEMLNQENIVTDSHEMKGQSTNNRQDEILIENIKNPQAKGNIQSYSNNQAQIVQIEKHLQEEPKQKLISENMINESNTAIQNVIGSKQQEKKQVNHLSPLEPVSVQNQSFHLLSQTHQNIQVKCQTSKDCVSLKQQKIMQKANNIKEKTQDKRQNMIDSQKKVEIFHQAKRLQIIDENQLLSIVFELIVQLFEKSNEHQQKKIQKGQEFHIVESKQEQQYLLIAFNLIVKIIEQKQLNDQIKIQKILEKKEKIPETNKQNTIIQVNSLKQVQMIGILDKNQNKYIQNSIQQKQYQPNVEKVSKQIPTIGYAQQCEQNQYQNLQKSKQNLNFQEKMIEQKQHQKIRGEIIQIQKQKCQQQNLDIQLQKKQLSNHQKQVLVSNQLQAKYDNSQNIHSYEIKPKQLIEQQKNGILINEGVNSKNYQEQEKQKLGEKQQQHQSFNIPFQDNSSSNHIEPIVQANAISHHNLQQAHQLQIQPQIIQAQPSNLENIKLQTKKEKVYQPETSGQIASLQPQKKQQHQNQPQNFPCAQTIVPSIQLKTNQQLRQKQLSNEMPETNKKQISQNQKQQVQQQQLLVLPKKQQISQELVHLHQSAAFSNNISKEMKQQKLKYKMQTESFQSVYEEKGQHQKRIVEFTQFVPSQKPKDQNKNSLQVQKQRQIKVKTQGRIQQKQEIDNNKKQKEIDFSIRPAQESQKKKLKTIEVMQDEMKAKQSPAKQSGRISKRPVYDKKIHQIVKELSKHDEKKVQLPILDQSRKSKKRNIDLSKLESHIGLTSNVMNFTVGEVTSCQDDQNAEKLLNEIESLKSKLSQLQRKKEQREHMEKYASPEKDFQIPVGTIASIKSAKKQCTGRIYKKIQPGQSRISEQVQTFHSEKKGNYFGVEPTTILSAPRQRLTSTLGFQTLKQLNLDSDGDNNKTMNINFRVRKPSKGNQGFTDFDGLQKESGISGNTFQERVEQDKCFQTSRRQDAYQKIQFSQQQMLPSIEKPSPRNLDFQSNFRENIERYFLQLGQSTPRRQMSQQQLIMLAKQTFSKFGVSLRSERSIALNIKKYKNCISFILDAKRTILWYYQGKFYFGGWNLNKVGEGEKSEWGYELVPGKYVYSGGFKQNKRHGYGIIKFISREKDTIYEGEWVNGFKQGIGKQIEPDGIQYVGAWLQGRKHGYGTIRISDQQYFEGNFIGGIKNGEGTEVFKNGDTYQGNYRDGKFEGKGTYVWANHSKYEGNFIEGVRNGNGIWVANYLDSISDRYQGQYKNDKKNGFGIYKWKDGTSYQGQFLNDLKHGEGTVSYGDGRKAALQWNQGSVVARTEGVKGIKRTSRGNSQKSESQKGQKTIKGGSETKSKGTRIPLGVQKL